MAECQVENSIYAFAIYSYHFLRNTLLDTRNIYQNLCKQWILLTFKFMYPKKVIYDYYYEYELKNYKNEHFPKINQKWNKFKIITNVLTRCSTLPQGNYYYSEEG